MAAAAAPGAAGGAGRPAAAGDPAAVRRHMTEAVAQKLNALFQRTAAARTASAAQIAAALSMAGAQGDSPPSSADTPVQDRMKDRQL